MIDLFSLSLQYSSFQMDEQWLNEQYNHQGNLNNG